MISLFLFFILCKRCGQCCYYVLDGKTKKCKYLVVHKHLTSCRIYRNRLDTKIDENIYCIERKDDKRIFKNCPFNAVVMQKMQTSDNHT